MSRAAHRSSSGALNCTCSLWFIYQCGDRPLPRLSGKWMKHVEPSINFGIINSILYVHCTLTEVFLNLTEVLLTLTGFSVLFPQL